MALRRFAILLLVLSAFSTLSRAQKADASFVAGGAFTTKDDGGVAITCTIPCPQPILFKNDHHIFYEGTGAIRLANFKVASLHLEIPVAGIPSQQMISGITATNVLKFSSLFVTPSLRLKLAPGAPVSPFVSIGGGWARYHISSGGTDNKGALQFGGGVDIKTGIPLLGFRAEVRDFVTARPEFTGLNVSTGPHKVLVGGGIVLRF